MGRERECTMALRRLVGTPTDNTFVATVTRVDGAVCTVLRKTDLKEFTNVRLNVSSTEKKGIVVTPKIDSDVLVTTINGYNWFVSQYSEIEKITVNADDTIIINGGNNDGLVIIQKLTNKINELVDWCKNHTHLLQIGTVNVAGNMGSATNASPINVPSPKSPPNKLNKKDYENKKIKH